MNYSASKTTGAGIRTVPIHNVLLIQQMLESEGVAAVELFRGTGVSPSITNNYDSLLTFEQIVKIVENAIQLSPKPGLGLEIGSNESPTDWGVLGFAMLSCKTIDETFGVISQFHKTAATLTEVSFSIEDDASTLEFLPLDMLSSAALPFVIEHQFSALHAVLGILTDLPVPVIELNLSYSKPAYADKYHEVFNCPVNFNQPRNQYVFSKSFLESPIVQCSSLGAALAKNLCETQLRRQKVEPDFIARVRYFMLVRGNDFSDAKTIAKCMNITSRTLRNRLNVLGTSFQEILDESRQHLAIRYLETSSLHVDDIAQLVGFSDTSNFRRAFKKWTGHVPSHYRKQNN